MGSTTTPGSGPERSEAEKTQLLYVQLFQIEHTACHYDVMGTTAGDVKICSANFEPLGATTHNGILAS